MAMWVGTSWKMTKTLAEARAFASVLRAADPARDPAIRRFVIPPFTLVREVKAMLADTSVAVGAQTMHWADAGPHTGEISAPMLTDCGLDMVELGHSERRSQFGETDETVALKVEAALRHGLTPLICIGETLADRDGGRADTALDAQVRGALARVAPDRASATSAAAAPQPILLAYEPVWAIGEAGRAAAPDYVEERHARIMATAAEVTGRRIPCLYGGSVDADNCADLIACAHVDGLFVGRAAWAVEGYLDILSRCSAALNRSVPSLQGEVS